MAMRPVLARVAQEQARMLHQWLTEPDSLHPWTDEVANVGVQLMMDESDPDELAYFFETDGTEEAAELQQLDTKLYQNVCLAAGSCHTFWYNFVSNC